MTCPAGYAGSYVLHKLERTQEACDELKPALDKFKGEWLLQHNLACYTCLLGNVEEARKLIEEAIELGGDVVRLRALDDEHLIRVGGGVERAETIRRRRPLRLMATMMTTTPTAEAVD